MADNLGQKIQAGLRLPQGDVYKHYKGLLDTFMRKARSDLPAALDFPGMPTGAALPILGMLKPAISKLVKNPSKMLNLFRKLSKTKSPTDSAISFGYAFRKSPQIRETLEGARKMAHETYDKAPIGSQARQDNAFLGQLLREASEEVQGVTPKGFSFLEQQAKRRVSAEQRKLYESGVHFLPEEGIK